MARQIPILPVSFPADTAIAGPNLVLVASGSNAGNVKLPAASGATAIIGVSKEAARTLGTQYELGVDTEGIVQCTFLTGVAITVGQRVQVGDSAGRVIGVVERIPLSWSTGTVVGVVGVALQARAAGDATGTLIDVLLTPGVTAII